MVERKKIMEETNDCESPSTCTSNSDDKEKNVEQSSQEKDNSSSSSSMSRPCQYSRYLRDKIMEINPHRVPCSFKEVLEENAQETLKAFSNSVDKVYVFELVDDRLLDNGVSRTSTMSDTEVVALGTLPLWFSSDPNVKSQDVGGTRRPLRSMMEPYSGTEEFNVEQSENNKSPTHGSGLKPSVSLDDLLHRSGAKSCDETFPILTDDTTITSDGPDDSFCLDDKRCQQAWEEMEKRKSEPPLHWDLLYDKISLSLSTTPDSSYQEVSGWSVCPCCISGLGSAHTISPRRRATSPRVTCSAPSKSTTPLPARNVKRSGSSENINTIAKFLSWKPYESSPSKTKSKASSAKKTPVKVKANPHREPGAILSPRKPEIKYKFFHDKSHRSYMRNYRTSFTDRNLYPSFGLNLSNRDMCLPKVLVNSRDDKCGSSVKVSQFKFKVASTLKTSNKVHTKPKASSKAKAATPPPSPNLSPVVCRSRPSIPCNARGVVCPTSLETPQHIVTPNKTRATLPKSNQRPVIQLTKNIPGQSKCNKIQDLTLINFTS